MKRFLILIMFVATNLSGAFCGRNSGNYQNGRYESPGYAEDEVVNIGNGVNRKNVVFLNQGDDDDAPYKNTRSRTNNIGNGYNNQNTVVMGGGPITDTRGHFGSGADDWSTSGTSFVHHGENGMDLFHVGYGKGNKNLITVNGKPMNPDCYGSACNHLQQHPRQFSGASSHRAFPLFLIALSVCYVILT